MAKRFTATEKWNDGWFQQLPTKYKILWLYMLDTCDIAGIWEVNFRTARAFTGYNFKPEEVLATFQGKVFQVVTRVSKWYIPNFIKFQYGELREQVNLHAKVLKLLADSGLSYPFNSPTEALHGRDMDKDKDKEESVQHRAFSEIEFVKITEAEWQKLIMRFKSEKRALESVQILDNYLGQSKRNQKRYTSHYRVILSWVEGELEKRERARNYQKRTNETPVSSAPRSGKIETPFQPPKTCSDHPEAKFGPQGMCLECFPVCAKCKQQHIPEEGCDEWKDRMKQLKGELVK